MANITDGLPGGGQTLFYRIRYEDSLKAAGGPEPARTSELVVACDGDFAIMQRWFGGKTAKTPINVTVTKNDGGATWNTGDPQSVTINPANRDSAALRYFLVSEVTEIFMFEYYKSWFASGGWLSVGGVADEGSMGEGLSRFLAALFMIEAGIGAGPIDNSNVSIDWLNSPRNDYINHDPDDNKPDQITGCTTLFLYYLHVQFGFNIISIIKAGAGSFAGVYQRLTKDQADPFVSFKELLDANFPSTINSQITNSNIDNPFPLPTPRTLSTLRYIAALPPIQHSQSLRTIISQTGQDSLRPTLNSNRAAALL